MDTEVKKALDLRLAKGDISLAEYKEMLFTIAENEGIHNSKGEPLDCQPPNRRDENLQPILVVDQDLSLFDAFLMHKGKKYLYSEIKSLSFSRFLMTMNLVPTSNTTDFSIEFDNGETVDCYIDKSFLRGQKSKLLEQAFLFLQKTTATQRFKKVIETLKKDGFVNIPLTPVRLYLDGTIEDGKLRFNLKHCYVGLGTQTLRSVSPNGIRVRDKPPPFVDLFPKEILFTLQKNVDVYKGLIKWIAQQPK